MISQIFSFQLAMYIWAKLELVDRKKRAWKESYFN